MLTYLRTSIFDSPAQTLVNTVNTVGVMGKGVAKEFKSQFPAMFKEYKQLCDEGELEISTLHLWRGPSKWVLNFPTKTTWRRPSKLQFVETGLKKFVEVYEELGIFSISFPALGCGNGNLNWRDVKPMMEYYLKPLPVRVFIHDRHVKPGFVPEHMEGLGNPVPTTFDEFTSDVKSSVFAKRGIFHTLSTGTEFQATYEDDLGLKIHRNSKYELLPIEQLEQVWTALQCGILSSDQFSGEAPRRYKSYLFGILATLPYIDVAEVKHVRNKNSASGIGLFLLPNKLDCDDLLQPIRSQAELWGSQ